MYSREIDGRALTFASVGILYEDTFVLFDEETESLWYPLDDTQWTAVSGPRKGETFPFIGETPVLTLGEWRKKHPNTKVLLGSKSDKEEK